MAVCECDCDCDLGWAGLSLSGRQGVSAELQAAACAVLAVLCWNSGRQQRIIVGGMCWDCACVSENRLVVGWRRNTNGVQSVGQSINPVSDK